ncbi:MAG: hypothetical protein QOF02_1336 [Blastocatellia bacterium]|nr:hypothetical protein [Blastocatellia bacterium]
MNQLDLNINASQSVLAERDAAAAARESPSPPALSAATTLDARLGLWLRALPSFFDAANYPFTEAEQADLSKRDFAGDIRIARSVLWDCSRLTFQLAQAESSADELLEQDEQSPLGELSLAEETGESSSVAADQSLVQLAETLGNYCMLCDELLTAGAVGISAWSNLGKMLTRDLERSEAAKHLIRSLTQRSDVNLQPQLISLTRQAALQRSFGTDLSAIFNVLARMLNWLATIEAYLQRDAPLKQTLPVFTLINQETRELRRFVENRTMRIENLETTFSDTLDGTNYALAMELRKVFSRELVGLGTLRHPPTLYAKVETAHGILRDSFQQSIVGLAQLFDQQLDGTLLFKAYQTKKEQSLILRHDLWMLLQLIQLAEKERDQHPLVRLLERLVVFQEGSLRYLMYKDWEACERFIEEVGAARGAVELAPVLHRFAAFVETLFGQVSMRAVLADTPFDFPTLEN